MGCEEGRERVCLAKQDVQLGREGGEEGCVCLFMLPYGYFNDGHSFYVHKI